MPQPFPIGEQVRTTCAYCGVGCGIVATRTGERAVEIKGDIQHPANHGRLCSKGTHLGETVGLDGAPPLRVRIGNTAATRLVFRGQPTELAGFTRDNVARLELK